MTCLCWSIPWKIYVITWPPIVACRDEKGQMIFSRWKRSHCLSCVSPGFLKPARFRTLSETTQLCKCFGRWICAMAARDSRLVAITPAMREGSDLIEFSKHYPIVITMSDCRTTRRHVCRRTGLQRTQTHRCHLLNIFNSVLMINWFTMWLYKIYRSLAIDRAGLVGGDGATHQVALISRIFVVFPT